MLSLGRSKNVIVFIFLAIIGSVSAQISKNAALGSFSTQNYEPLIGDFAAGLVVAAFIYFVLWFVARILDGLYDNGTGGTDHLDDMLDYSGGLSNPIAAISVLIVLSLIGTGILGPYLDTIQSLFGGGLLILPGLILSGLGAVAVYYGIGNAGTVGIPGIIGGAVLGLFGLLISPGGIIPTILFTAGLGGIGLGAGAQFGAGFLGIWNRPSGRAAGNALRAVDNNLPGGPHLGSYWDNLRNEVIVQHQGGVNAGGCGKLVYVDNLKPSGNDYDFGNGTIVQTYECPNPNCNDEGVYDPNFVRNDNDFVEVS